MQQEFPLTSLGHQVLAHWTESRPGMVGTLEAANQLEESVFETQETCAEMLYQLLIVQKLNYPAAWEIVRAEWMLPEEESTVQDRFLSQHLTQLGP